MKKSSALLLLTVKTLTLLCFTNMGWLALQPSLNAKQPCHQSEPTTQVTVKDCDTCVTALNTWMQDRCFSSILEPLKTIVLPSRLTWLKAPVKLTKTLSFYRYRPPPKVVHLNAFDETKNSIVIIV